MAVEKRAATATAADPRCKLIRWQQAHVWSVPGRDGDGSESPGNALAAPPSDTVRNGLRTRVLG